MAWLKIYGWEQRVFKDMYNIHLLPTIREKAVFAFAKFFDIQLNKVMFTTRGNGRTYTWGKVIKLPRKDCPLGLVFHELAHLYNSQKLNGRGHRGSFKKCLIKLQVEGKYAMPSVFRGLYEQQSKSMEAARA